MVGGQQDRQRKGKADGATNLLTRMARVRSEAGKGETGFFSFHSLMSVEQHVLDITVMKSSLKAYGTKVFRVVTSADGKSGVAQFGKGGNRRLRYLYLLRSQPVVRSGNLLEKVMLTMLRRNQVHNGKNAAEAPTQD